MKKYIADTNFILRYLLADNQESYHQTKIIFEQARIGKCQIEIEQSVFAEVIFVLSSFYEVPRLEIVKILKSLLSYKGIKVDSDIYSVALDVYLEHNIHIVDSIIAVKTLTSGDELLTFDKKLQNVILKKLNSENNK
ncbi:MAG: PIN domain-containing protein [Rickettsiales bacterium]|nr:MAG: PIN domain-containing protein [Rickettsiales bacterium]